MSKSEIAYQAKISGDTDKETFGQINRFIEKYGLSDQVQVLGRIPDDQLLIELKESDVLIHLSRIDSYPLIVLESIACGTFPICMELAGARDMVETYAGQIVSSSNAVSETVAFLGSTPVEQLRRKAFEASRSLQRDYSWEECVRLLRSALEQTISATMAENASSRKQRNQGTN